MVNDTANVLTARWDPIEARSRSAPMR